MIGAYKILIVDDSNFIRLTLRKYLQAQKSAPIEVTEAYDGKRALEILATQEFDLILTDLEMPNMNGLQLISELRRNPKYDGIPIIFLTSVDSSATKVEAFECGATDYLIKPCISEELVARILAHLERKFMNEAMEKKAVVAENLTTFYRSLQSLNLEELETNLISMVIDHLHIGSVALWEYSPRENQLLLKRGSDELASQPKPHSKDNPLMWKAFEQKTPFFHEELSEDEIESLGFNIDAYSGSVITTLPLFFEETLLGALNLTNVPEDFFTTFELTHFETIQHYISNIFMNARSYRLIQDKQLQTEQELEQAKRTQLAVLPQKIPEFPFMAFTVKYDAMEQIGGDLYDIIEFSKGRVGILVADVTGHGIPAALISCMSVSLFRAMTTHNDVPADVLHHINQELVPRIPDGKFVTAFYSIYDPTSHTLFYSIGGHPEGYLLRGNEVIPLNENIGLPLGIFGGDISDFEGASVTLQKHDRVLLYTDGIIEIAPPSGELYGNSRLKEFLAENHELPLSELLDKVYHHALDYSQKEAFDDDITLVAFEILE